MSGARLVDDVLFEVSPKGKRLPIVLSVPHCGTDFPDEVAPKVAPDLRKSPPDTDWHVEKLYDFAPELGATLIHARYSRYVIDLNRDPSGSRLYSDKRIETRLIPEFTFSGERIYERYPSKEEIARRLERYFWPYYRHLEQRLTELKREFGVVLFYDCHSIRRHVPSIREEPFPDMILGDDGGRTAASEISDAALKNLRGSGYDVTHNDPFRGGHLTRYFGRPDQRQHAVQLEMSWDVYMEEDGYRYERAAAARIREALSANLAHLASEVLPRLRSI